MMLRRRGASASATSKRLQRDILPDGISSREEAEILLALDRTSGRADPSLADWLVAMMVDFVVWGTRPHRHNRYGHGSVALVFPFRPKAHDGHASPRP